MGNAGDAAIQFRRHAFGIGWIDRPRDRIAVHNLATFQPARDARDGSIQVLVAYAGGGLRVVGREGGAGQNRAEAGAEKLPAILRAASSYNVPTEHELLPRTTGQGQWH